MAKIVSSDAAPLEAVHYALGQSDFDLGGGGKKTYETDDASVIAAATEHPWLDVEVEPVELVQGAYVNLLAPEDDHLSAAGQTINPNDPDEVRKAEEAKAEEFSHPVAIEAGLEQSKPVTTTGVEVAETLAADDTSKTFDKVGE